MNEELVEIISKIHQRLEAIEERDQRDQKERKQISSVIETLQNQLKDGEEKVRSMEQRLQTTRRSLSEQHKKEMEEEHDKVFTFIFKLEQRDKHLSYDVVDKIEDDQLRRAASVLVQEYNVRLLAIDSGLNFVLDIPQREQSIIEARKLEIGEVLKTVFPRNLRQEVRFEAPAPMVLKQSIRPNAENQYGKRSRTTVNMKQGPCGRGVKPEAELARNQRSTEEVPDCDDYVFWEGKEDPPEVKKSDEDKKSTELERKHSTGQLISGDRKRKTSVFYSGKARPMDTFESAKDIQIENLKARIRQLEEKLNSEKTRHVDRLHAKLRNDDERMLSVSFPFFPQKGTMGSVFDALLSADLAKNAGIFGRLQTLKVSLQGVFLNYSLDEDGKSDDSLAFVLQTSIADFQNVKGYQQEIRDVLAEILQGTQVCWSDMAAGIFPTIPMKERKWSSPGRQHPKHF